MADNSSDQMILDPNALIATPGQDGSPIVSATAEDQSDIVSQAFTSVEQDGQPVEYVTMTEEEAAAHGVMEEDQVVTTSLQFDPANPSVLYTADGTLINRSDLSPEEQALVQAALQQHLAEQEAEQQLAAIDQQQGAAANQGMEMRTEGGEIGSDSGVPVSGIAMADEIAKQQQQSTVDTDMLTNSTDMTGMTTNAVTTSVNLASPNTNAAQIVQTLANNVRRQQEYAKAQSLLNQARAGEKPTLPQGYRYEEKIVIRQGQPHVMKMPVKKTAPQPQKKSMPELPPALANLMPKVDIGKDGNQVIRIHQSQITAEQLKSLQENPNVRLVFRPPSSNRRGRGGGAPYTGKRRGRPRKNPYQVNRGSPEPTASIKSFDESPPTTTRYGRHTKLPYYSKDYLSTENGDIADESEQSSYPSLQQQQPPYNYHPTSTRGKRGRPRGSGRSMDKAYRRSGPYATRMDMIREQQLNDEELEATQRLSIVPPKPALSSVEQAISTRRKNRLKELLDNCTEDDIMEVALPHLARVFSLWEFLVMKVEKSKVSRVYFADVYKEYESLHKYVARLTEKYSEAIVEKRSADAAKKQLADAEKSSAAAEDGGEKKEGEVENDENKTTVDDSAIKEQDELVKRSAVLTIKCKKLAESLGLTGMELEDAFITLIDAKLPGAKKKELEEQQQLLLQQQQEQQQNEENEDKTVADSMDEMMTSIVGSAAPVSMSTDAQDITADLNNILKSAMADEPQIQTTDSASQLLQTSDVATVQTTMEADDITTTMQQLVNETTAQQQQITTTTTSPAVSMVDPNQAVTESMVTSSGAGGAPATQEQEVVTSMFTTDTMQQQQQISTTTDSTAAATSMTVDDSNMVAAAASSAAVATEPMQVDPTVATAGTSVEQVATEGTTIETTENGTAIVPASTNGAQIIQIGTGDDRQYIEVPEGYTLIQTPNGLVMSQPGTTITQGEDGTIYVTNEDGTSTPLDAQKSFPLETVESLLSLDNQPQQ